MSPRIWVPGVPAPQGSKRYVGRGKGGRGIMLESSKSVGPWRERVAIAADELELEPTRSALTLNARFVFLRPNSHYGSRECATCAAPSRAELLERARDAGVQGRSKMSAAELAGALELELPDRSSCSACGGSGRERYVLPSAPRVPAGRPDLSKLIRAVEDALAGIAYADDAQIVGLNAGKEYGNAAGAELVWNVIA